MSDFTTAYAAINLDPFKRVHYAPGLVLGVEDFVQEEVYLLARDRLHNRALHGYGTVCGLRVETQNGDDGRPRILVRAGIALDPLGREIRVPEDQCAGIDDWLAANAEALAGSPLPDPLQLYLVLCYRECTTDDVPVPGGPCRSLEASRVPSRIADDFELTLSATPPPQAEEDAVRAFGELLRVIEISDAPGDFLTGEELDDLVRGLGGGGPGGIGPGSPALYRLHPDTAAELLEAAFRVWVTEVRSSLLPAGRNCASGPPAEACVLLARVDLTLEAVGGVLRLLDGDLANAVVDEDRRPYLLHTRLLQEWLRNKSDSTPGAAGGDLDGAYPDPTVVGLQGNPVAPAPSPLTEGDLLTWGGAAWEARTLTFGGDLAGDAPDPTVVGLQGNPVAAAPSPLTEGDLLTWGGAAWEARTLIFGGDLAGDAPDPIVVGLQGDPVAPAPSPLVVGQVLTWNGAAWQAAELPPGISDHGDLTGLGDVTDHPGYLTLDGTRAMAGNLDLAGNDIDMGGVAANPAQIRNLSPGTAAGHAVPFQQAVKVGDAAGGDLAGTYPNPRIRAPANPAVSGQVLTWVGGNWVAQPPIAAGVQEMQEDLVRIQALSWRHGESTNSIVTLDGNQVFGLVVQFGIQEPGDAPVRVVRGSLDYQSFQVFVRAPFLAWNGQTQAPVPGLYQWIGIEALDQVVIPVEGQVAPGTTAVQTVAGPTAPAAAFLIDPRALVLLWFMRDNLGMRIDLRIQIHGDQVLDERGRAIDANHLRASLPSGDRAGGSDPGLGLQGGLFESWITIEALPPLRDFGNIANLGFFPGSVGGNPR